MTEFDMIADEIKRPLDNRKDNEMQEDAASVGAMLPVTEPDQILDKKPLLEESEYEESAPTHESINEEFSALRLTNIEESDQPFTEGANLDMKDIFKDACKTYKACIKEAKKAFKAKDYKKSEEAAGKAEAAMASAAKLIGTLDQTSSSAWAGWFFQLFVDLAKYTIAAYATFGIACVGGFALLAEDIINDEKAWKSRTNNGQKSLSTKDSINGFQNRLTGYAIRLQNSAASMKARARQMGNQMGQIIQESGEDGLDAFGAEVLQRRENIERLTKETGMGWFENVLDSIDEESSENIFLEDVNSDEDVFVEDGSTKDIDSDIKPIINMLNEKGYKTKYSCSGHPSARAKNDVYRDGIKDGKLYSTARVVFAEVYDFPDIPKYWTKKILDDEKTAIYVKPPHFRIINGLPEAQFKNWKERYMRNLESWAKALPKKSETKDDPNAKVAVHECGPEELLREMQIDLL